MTEKPKPSETPYLHVRPPQRIVGVGGEGDRPTAKLYANRAGLLAQARHVALVEGLARLDHPRRPVEASEKVLVTVLNLGAASAGPVANSANSANSAAANVAASAVAAHALSKGVAAVLVVVPIIGFCSLVVEREGG